MIQRSEPRSAYKHFLKIPTRWKDNDVYQHVNNVVYYSFFDTVINEYLICVARYSKELTNTFSF